MGMGNYERVRHEFPPVYNENSRILILGSLPSVKSREQMFYYGHPQNRFWKVIAGLSICPIHDTGEKSVAACTGNSGFGCDCRM